MRYWQNICAFLLCIIVVGVIILPLVPNQKSTQKGNSVNNQTVSPSFSILIDLSERKLYLLNYGKLYKSYRCAVGKPSTPSPTGSFVITNKAMWGEGFGGWWMGINCPWGNYGIHGTTMPETIGSAASHGCFRMRSNDARELYSLVHAGTAVLIVDGSFGPFGKEFHSIGPGSIGENVQAVQKRLHDISCYSGPCNGRFDAPGFLEAVHRYQKKNDLPVSDWITKKMVEKLGFALME